MKTIHAFLITVSLSLIPAIAQTCRDGSCGAHSASCQTGCCGHGESHGTMAMNDGHGTYFLDFADSLGLTQDQISTLNKIRNDARKQAADLSAKIQKAWQGLTAASHEAKPNKKTMQKASKEIGDLKGRMILSHAMSLLQAREVLTPEQHKKITDAHAAIDLGAKKPESKTCH